MPDTQNTSQPATSTSNRSKGPLIAALLLGFGGLLLVGGGMALLWDESSSSSSSAAGSISEDVSAFVEDASIQEIDHGDDYEDPYTKEELLADADAVINILHGEPQKNTDLSLKPSDTTFGALRARFDELSPAEQELYAPYVVPMTDRRSFMHPANWPRDGKPLPSPLADKPVEEGVPTLSWFIPSSGDEHDHGHEHDDHDRVHELFGIHEAEAVSLNCGVSGDFIINCFNEDDQDYATLTAASNPNIRVHVPVNPGDYDDGANTYTTVQLEDYLAQQAFVVRDTALQAYPKITAFLGNTPEMDLWLMGTMSMTEGGGVLGLAYDCDELYINVFGSNIKTTTAHEMFHCLQHDNGIIPWYGYADNKKWMIEGGAEFGEHVADVDHVGDGHRYSNYASKPKVSLFDKSYDAALLFTHIFEDYVSPTTVSGNMQVYAGNHSNKAQSQLLWDKWHDYMINFSGDEQVETYANALAPWHNGAVDLQTDVEEVPVFGFPQYIDVNLPPMSMNYFNFQLQPDVQTKSDYIRVDFGTELDLDNVEMSALMYTSDGVPTFDKKFQPLQDDEGNHYALFCFNDNTPCQDEGLTIHEGLQRVFLIVTNRHWSKSYVGDAKVFPWGANDYFLYKVKYGTEGEIPISGSVKLEVDGEEGTMRTESRRFWLRHKEEFYKWDQKFTDAQGAAGNVTIHPSRLTNYVNDFCSFRGFMEFDFELKKEDAQPDNKILRTYDLDRTDQGNFHVTPHQFICEFDPEKVARLGLTPESFFIEQFAISRLNTFQGDPGTFAAQQEVAFVALMTLGLINDAFGESVEMFYEQDSGGERIEMKFNNNFSAWFYRENS